MTFHDKFTELIKARTKHLTPWGEMEETFDKDCCEIDSRNRVCKNSGIDLCRLPNATEKGGNMKWYFLKACVTSSIQAHAFLHEKFNGIFFVFVIFIRLTKPCGWNKAFARQTQSQTVALVAVLHVMSSAKAFCYIHSGALWTRLLHETESSMYLSLLYATELWLN